MEFFLSNYWSLSWFLDWWLLWYNHRHWSKILSCCNPLLLSHFTDTTQNFTSDSEMLFFRFILFILTICKLLQSSTKKDKYLWWDGMTTVSQNCPISVLQGSSHPSPAPLPHIISTDCPLSLALSWLGHHLRRLMLIYELFHGFKSVGLDWQKQMSHSKLLCKETDLLRF